MHRVFISYAHKDKTRAEKVHEDLDKANLVPIRDDRVLAHDTRIRTELRREVETCDAFLLLLTRHSARSNYVQSEYELARRLGKPVVAVVLGDDDDNLESWPWWYSELHDTKHIPGNYLVQGLRDEIIRAVQEKVRRARIVAFFNMKGGVGKTTLAAQFAARLAKGSDAGRRPLSTLMIDLDPQQSLTELFVTTKRLEQSHGLNHSVVGLCEPALIGRTRTGDLAEVVDTPPVRPPDYAEVPLALGTGEASIGNPVRFDLVAGDFEGTRYTDERGVNRHMLVYHFEHALNHFLTSYDMIVLDCNPSVSPLTHCALLAHHLVMPIEPNDFGRRGFQFVRRFMQRHLEDQNEWPRRHAVLNKVRGPRKPKRQTEFIKALRKGDDFFGGPGMKELSEVIMDTEIPLDLTLGHLRPVFDTPTLSAHSFVDGSGRSDADIERFVDELLARTTAQAQPQGTA